MTLGVAAILTKLAGPTAGLLLVLYGTLSLWLGRTTDTLSPTRQKFCALLLCESANLDSPTAVASPADQPLSQARANLLLDPASAYRWADMADAEVDARNIEGGKFCVRQALAAAPGNPAILFRASNFYLRVEDYPETLRHLIAVLRNPDLAAYYDRVFALYSQMDLPLEDLLNQGLPHTPEAANEFLRFWISQNKLEEAQDTWTWINKNSLTSLQSAGYYVTLLTKAGRWDDAMRSWGQYVAQLDPTYNKTNWIYNGSFETASVDCPFDWHLASSNSVQVERDSESMYKGVSSLRLKFLARQRTSEPQAYQTVYLKPGTWEIKAAMKTAALVGDQGVLIRVFDSQDPARLDSSTNTFAGTQAWATVSKIFQVSSGTRLVQVEIIHIPSPDLTSIPSGSAWVDDITLTPVP